MMMFLIKLLSIIVFDLCTNICCIYSICKNCCKDDAIKETNLRNENFLKLIEFKKDGKVYYNGSNQGFDQIDSNQVDGIVNPEYSETVFFYEIDKVLYNSITRKSYIKFNGIKNIRKNKKKLVKKNKIKQTLYVEARYKNDNDNNAEENENQNENENRNENENQNENKNKIIIKDANVKEENVYETSPNNIKNENNPQEKNFLNQNEQETYIDETEEDNCSDICLYDSIFENCDVANMDKYVLFAVKTQNGNCYLGFCRDGNRKEVMQEEGGGEGNKRSIKGLFSGSKVNEEIKMISCGGKLESVMYMFRNNSNLKNIVFTPLFVPLSVTSMFGMFDGCSELNELDLFNFNSASTSEKNQIDMCFMFNECRKLEKLTFPDFDNGKFNLICSNMFIGCTNLRKCNLMVDNDKIIADFGRCKSANIKLDEELKKKIKEKIKKIKENKKENIPESKEENEEDKKENEENKNEENEENEDEDEEK